MTTLTLLYPDGSEWIAGGFHSPGAAEAWAAQQRLDPSVQLRIASDAAPSAPTLEQLWAALRVARDSRLSDCDWTQLLDAPLPAEEKSAWMVYRQALRDLPANTTDPANPAWPAPPGGSE